MPRGHLASKKPRAFQRATSRSCSVWSFQSELSGRLSGSGYQPWRSLSPRWGRSGAEHRGANTRFSPQLSSVAHRQRRTPSTLRGSMMGTYLGVASFSSGSSLPRFRGARSRRRQRSRPNPYGSGVRQEVVLPCRGQRPLLFGDGSLLGVCLRFGFWRSAVAAPNTVRGSRRARDGAAAGSFRSAA